MSAFRILLAFLFVSIVGYTTVVIANHGIGLFPVFFGDMAKMGWPGQFNLDFMGLLALSGLWLAWRHHFSPAGLALGVLGFLGGAPVLTAYPSVASLQAKGDPAELLLGKARARSARNQTGRITMPTPVLQAFRRQMLPMMAISVVAWVAFAAFFRSFWPAPTAPGEALAGC